MSNALSARKRESWSRGMQEPESSLEETSNSAERIADAQHLLRGIVGSAFIGSVCPNEII
jgi:hypothetical protein